MKKRITATIATSVVALLCGLSPSDPSEASNNGQQISVDDSTKHACPEYTPGRVIVGEFQTLKCDVRPPQKLDVVLFKGKLDGLTPRERCDHSGGHFHKHRNGQLRCNGIDH